MKKMNNILTSSGLKGILLTGLLALLLPANQLVAQCNPDVTPPVCTAPPDLTITRIIWDSLDIDLFNMPDEMPKVQAAFGTLTHWDNCDQGNSTIQESYYIYGPSSAPTKIQRRFFATDAAGNLGEAVQYITILSTYTMHVPAWNYPGQAPVDTMTLLGEFGHVLYDPEDSYFPAPCPGGYAKIERNWYFIDWFYMPGGNTVEDTLPVLDLNQDGIPGDAYDIIAIGDTIWLYQNNVPTQPLIGRATALFYPQILYNSRIVRGIVHLDTLLNCTLDSTEARLAGFKVKAIGQTTNTAYTAFTDADGAFELLVCTPDSTIELGLDLPYNYGGACPSTYTLSLVPGPVTVQDLAVPLNSSCRLLTVDIATWRLRPCMPGSYWVNYCNYSDQIVEDTYVDVALDTFIQYTGATLPGVLQSGNTYRFETGDLQPGACGQFRIDFLLDCDVLPGLTHCTAAYIHPVDSCPPALPWSGADLRASGHCDGDSIRFILRNIGSGDMANPLDFIVTEDIIMVKSSTYQLSAGATMTVAEPSSGATWRLESQQEPGHPWGGLVTAVVEGCNGLNTPGLVNMFPVNDPDPFSSLDCTQNTSSYDPNDKQAFPTGYDDEHFIRQNTDIEYLIRFQNTGTDTAFQVVLLDTLSGFLDAAAVRPGASSHPYDFDVLDGNVLRFRFDRILLPDSTVNEPASHGFVKFRVPQQTNNPLGTVIQNRAGIYFDFNAPVMTNVVWHTIGDNFVLVQTGEPSGGKGALRVFPNPAVDRVTFEMPDAGENRQFMLTDVLGKTIVAHRFSGNVYGFERSEIPAGVYVFQITEGNERLYSGKLIIR